MNFLYSFSQEGAGSFLIDVDTIQSSSPVENSVGIFIDSNNKATPQNLLLLDYSRLSKYNARKKIPRRLVVKQVFLLLNLRNNSLKPEAFYFFPGMHYDQLKLYKKTASRNIEKINNKEEGRGFAFLEIPAGSLQTYVVELRFSKTDNNAVEAILISPQQYNQFRAELGNVRRNTKTAGFLLSGALLMMIFFTIVNYFITGKIEFLYNFIYSICMFLLIFLSTYLLKTPGWFSSFFLEYLDLLLLIVGTIFYLAFTRQFLNTRIIYPALDKLFKIEIWILGALMLLYTVVHYATDLVEFENVVENTMKIIGLLSGVVYIIMSFSKKDRLMNYLAIGNAIQIFFFCISLFIILNKIRTTNFANSSLFYFELGIVASVFFFLLGLTYKNRHELIQKIKEQEAMKTEVEKQALENQIAIIKAQQQERSRISADMHDDLGAGMTSIRLYSEIAKNKMGDRKIEEIEKISASADELLNNMNAIIWSMSSENDSLGNMVAYIRSYSFEYLENNSIQTIFTIPERLPAIQVTGEIRRNIFLVVKEALHNIVKHSGATEVKIIMKKEVEGLSLLIHDNGKGINKEKIREFGNGIKNMKKRMHAINVDFSIENNNGTTIRLYSKTRF